MKLDANQQLVVFHVFRELLSLYSSDQRKKNFPNDINDFLSRFRMYEFDVMRKLLKEYNIKI